MSGGVAPLAAIEQPRNNPPVEPSRVLLTGASGFVGGHLRPVLESSGATVLTLARDHVNGQTVPVDSDASVEAWVDALADVDTVVHLAAIAHVAGAPNPATLKAVNVDWPVRLFEAAAVAGVRNFVFLSSIKVFGGQSVRPFLAEDPCAPDDAYGESKVQAEQGLRLSAQQHVGTRLAVLRAPLVYGPGVKANFRTLLGWAARGARGWPLPFGAARAPRSLISSENLAEAIVASIGQSGVFHCADPVDLSVAELFRNLGVPQSRLLPIPAFLMRIGLGMIGRSGVYQRIYAPLQLEIEKSAVPGWSPRFTSAECLQRTMASWRT